MTLSEKLIDKRVLRRHLERGLVKKTEFESYLAALPDLSSNVDDQAAGAASGEPARREYASVPHP